MQEDFGLHQTELFPEDCIWTALKGAQTIKYILWSGLSKMAIAGFRCVGIDWTLQKVF